MFEKLALALYYSNLSIKKAFDCFDLDKNGSISRNEFYYGITKLNLGFFFNLKKKFIHKF